MMGKALAILLFLGEYWTGAILGGGCNTDD